MPKQSSYTPELATIICQRMIAGESLRAICREDGMPSAGLVCLWLTQHPSFAEQYAHAREHQAEAMFEEMMEIADDGRNDTFDDDGKTKTNWDVIGRSKLRVDTRKWSLARMAPKKYGDKISQDITSSDGALGNLNEKEIATKLTAIMDAAMKRMNNQPSEEHDDDEYDGSGLV